METYHTSDGSAIANVRSYALELVHTKAVRGMCKTEARRPFHRKPNGEMSKSQRWWMLSRPTLDSLWHRPWARAFDLRIARAIRKAASNA